MSVFTSYNPPRLHPHKRYADGGEYYHERVLKVLQPYTYPYRLGDTCRLCGMPYQAHPSSQDMCDDGMRLHYEDNHEVFPHFFITTINPNTKTL